MMQLDCFGGWRRVLEPDDLAQARQEIDELRTLLREWASSYEPSRELGVRTDAALGVRKPQ